MPYKITATESFSDFKKKVELVFGNINTLAKQDQKTYSMQVLCNGFHEYAQDNGFYIDKEKMSSLRQEYIDWARKNSLDEKLLDSGWQVYIQIRGYAPIFEIKELSSKEIEEIAKESLEKRRNLQENIDKMLKLSSQDLNFMVY